MMEDRDREEIVCAHSEDKREREFAKECATAIAGKLRKGGRIAERGRDGSIHRTGEFQTQARGAGLVTGLRFKKLLAGFRPEE